MTYSKSDLFFGMSQEYMPASVSVIVNSLPLDQLFKLVLSLTSAADALPGLAAANAMMAINASINFFIKK